MAKTLQQIFTSGSDEINQNFTIESWHVSQSVDAFTGEEAYDITVSGSVTLTGSLLINGTSQSGGNNNVLTYNTTTGLVTYTSSNAVGTPPINTGSFLTTASVSSNTITFTKGDGSIFPLTINTGSFLTTASVSSNTITFTKGDGSIFPLTINTGSGGGGGIPGGSDQQIQYNSASTFDGDSGFTYVYTSQSLQQGNSTQARGLYSHAEGYQTTASGQYSHAEGYTTLASALVSHAEGLNTTASGDNSHAEGRNTVALGLASHAEGFGTVASGSYQHVQGQYNLSSSVQSAFIIGNGINASNRRNLLFTSASTFQISGSLFISGAAQSGGDNNVLTYNTTTGLVTYTASAAIGGGGGGGTGYTYEIGEYVSTEGGIIFDRWISGSNEWYSVISLEDVTTLVPFSNITGTGITGADSYWDGETNTNDIVAQPSHTTSAAQDCLDYVNIFGTAKTDWYLPSITELAKLWSNMFLVSKTLDQNGGSQILTNNTIIQPVYWSSTEASSTTAWALNSATGATSTFSKSSNNDVRAVRKFNI